MTQTLAELRAKATKGPWRRRNPPKDCHAVAFIEAPREEKDHPYDIEILGEDDTLYSTREGDIDFIVALVNAYDSGALVEREQSINEQMLDALKETERALSAIEDWCGTGMITGQRAKVWNCVGDRLEKARAAIARAEAGRR